MNFQRLFYSQKLVNVHIKAFCYTKKRFKHIFQCTICPTRKRDNFLIKPFSHLSKINKECNRLQEFKNKTILNTFSQRFPY